MADRRRSTAEENQETEKAVQKTAFSKEQILTSQKYQNRKDLINALLEDDKKYTITEVEQKIGIFMKGKVR